jgi:peptide/nickel transport system permease protein
MIPTLFGITLVTFFIMHLAPGDPVEAMSGGIAGRISREAHQQFLTAYGLDRPVYVQYWMWLGKVVRLDFGDSFVTGQPVIEVIMEKLPVTIYLNFVSIIVIFMIAIPSGILSAFHKDKFTDKFFGVFYFILYSLFAPWVAIFLLSVFSVQLNIFPLYQITSDYFHELSFFGKVADVAWHSVLPVIVMSYGGFAFHSRIIRGSVLDVLNQEYITTARAKGLPEKRVLKKHALRNALIPLVTIFGAILPSLIGGSVIIETIFNIDGMGRLFFFSMTSRDWFMIMGLTTISAILTLVGILLSDILYAVVDPRIRLD